MLIGQLAPGDALRFEMVGDAAAVAAEQAQDEFVATPGKPLVSSEVETLSLQTSLDFAGDERRGESPVLH